MKDARSGRHVFSDSKQAEARPGGGRAPRPPPSPATGRLQGDESQQHCRLSLGLVAVWSSLCPENESKGNKGSIDDFFGAFGELWLQASFHPGTWGNDQGVRGLHEGQHARTETTGPHSGCALTHSVVSDSLRAHGL